VSGSASVAQAVSLVVVGDTVADAQRQLAAWGLAGIDGIAVDGAAREGLAVAAGAPLGPAGAAAPLVLDALAAADAVMVYVPAAAGEVAPALDLVRGVAESRGLLLVALTLGGGERHLGDLRRAADLVVRGRDPSLLQEVVLSLLRPEGLTPARSASRPPN
jgi:hypothetical protein